MHKTILYLFIAALTSCHSMKNDEPVVSAEDYDTYLTDETRITYSLVHYTQEASFWESKLEDQPSAYLYLQKIAVLNHDRFVNTGDIHYLRKSDSLLRQSLPMVGGGTRVSLLLSLSSNAIKLHQFKEALHYALEANEIASDKYGPQLMAFDAYMELGEYDMAKSLLIQNKNEQDFNYLVRLSKFTDHSGDLDSAIQIMETAHKLARYSSTELQGWAKVQLGDMYGHAGQPSISYQYYLDALSINPNDLHALRGIAWIAYAHDRNTTEAKRILHFLSSQTLLPDAELFFAEIADYEGKDAEKQMRYKNFINVASRPEYDGMYNKYLIEIYNQSGAHDEAIALAKIEFDKRPNEATQISLAWAYCVNNQAQKALSLVLPLEGISLEPELSYYVGRIYRANNLPNKAMHYLREASASSYELGPVKAHIINQALINL